MENTQATSDIRRARDHRKSKAIHHRRRRARTPIDVQIGIVTQSPYYMNARARSQGTAKPHIVVDVLLQTHARNAIAPLPLYTSVDSITFYY